MNNLIQFFEFSHLPAHLQVAAIPFYEMAHKMISLLPNNPESTTAMRKLLESKDCAVRAILFKQP